ncbi:MAG TPA: SusC/RagA family TonB-linked outer membrane protein [Rubricoccaceae bacterium]|nr:SusC/RagA family TonB-linked outer membrane protein [Rubricoccaceae bacterium]
MDLHWYRRFGILLALLLAWGGAAAAQTSRVSGTVTDAETGDPLPGVNVIIQNTTTGTATDINGRYEIVLPSDQRTLVFSFVGFQSEEVEVPPGTSVVDMRLEEDVLGLEEVVVTGLATSVSRTNLANSVETISARELSEVTTPQTFDTALNGKITGAVVNAYTGAPGGGISIRLRGITTINGRSQPLFIVDGVIMSNDAISNGSNAVTAAAAGGNASNQDNPVDRIADLSPEDIESIEILKGPSAAAIYGARASNGVVIITTKRGRSGTGTQLSFSQSLGFTRMANPLGTRQFTAETAEAAYGERGRELFEAANGRFIDYEQELFGNTGLLSTTQLTAAGGNERTTFYASGLVKDDEGIIERTGYEKQSARLNLQHRFSSRATLDFTSNYIRSVARRGLTGNDNTGTTFGVALTATPNFINIRPDENGVYPEHPFNASNPLQTRDLSDISETNNRFLGSGRFTFNVLQRERQLLQFIAEGGVDYYGLSQSLLFPNELEFYQGVDFPGQSIQGRTFNLNTNLRGILLHSLAMPSSGLSFTTQAGIATFSQDLDRTTAVAAGLIPGQQNVDQAASLNTDEFRLFQDDRALFAQEEVNWRDRVILTGGVRAERSTLNGDVDQFFTYPKASVAFNVTNFDFWTLDQFDLLKLRFAYGQTGNTAPFGARFTTFGPVSIDGSVGLNINNTRGFAEVEPERASEIEGGFDVALFDGRASLDFTAYHKVVDNLILTRGLPASTGFAFEIFNGGELTNDGIEIGLGLIPVDMDDFQWVSRTSFWTNSAEVTRLDVPAFAAVGGGFGNTLGTIRIEEGRSPTQIVGIDDTDGDGSPDGVFQLGDAAPDFQMSFFNEFTVMRNLRLNVFGHWKQGGDNINLSELLFDLGGTSNDYDDDDDGDGETNAEERLAQLGVSARVFVQRASYFKLREVGLYYSVPDQLLGPAFGGRLRGLRLGVSAQNLFTITPYRSYDPEVHNFADTPVASGVEVNPYPSSRNVLFHVSFGL